MKEVTLRNSFRSLCTLTFTFFISLAGLSSFISQKAAFEIQNFLAITAGCVLGGVNGSASAGIFFMICLLGAPLFPGFEKGFDFFTSQKGSLLWGYFTGSLVSGLIIKHPSIYEKNDKNFIKKALPAVIAGFFASYVPYILYSIKNAEESFYCIIQKELLSINLQIAKTALSFTLTLLLRPLAAKLMYPGKESALKEKEELMQKLYDYNKKRNKNKEDKNK